MSIKTKSHNWTSEPTAFFILFFYIGKGIQKNTLPTLFHFVRVRVAHQPHVPHFFGTVSRISKLTSYMSLQFSVFIEPSITNVTLESFLFLMFRFNVDFQHCIVNCFVSTEMAYLVTTFFRLAAFAIKKIKKRSRLLHKITTRCRTKLKLCFV